MRTITAYSFVFLCLLVAAACYWPGLHGPFLFDDQANLMPLQGWLDGNASWQKIVFGNQSGLLGRPVSMASFLVSAMVGGLDPFVFKLHNLAIHLTTAVAIFFLLQQISRRDQVLKSAPPYFAAAITAIWLLHPFLASTVLYSVQRMAMLSALFTILAMLTYMHGRTQLERDQKHRAAFWLFVVVPLFSLLAILSKENGALALPLCAILELVYFGNNCRRRPLQARIFLLLSAGLPMALAVALLIVAPDFYFAGYANRPFTPSERLLTQSRVLFDYISSILLPIGNTFSLYRDDYALSTGLFSPVTTFLSVSGLAAIFASMYAFRNLIPGFSAGMAIFFIGHSIESTIFPLLIYFEHRNYLPSIGLLLAVASLLIFLFRRVRIAIRRPLLLSGTATFGLITVLAFATLGRAYIWQSHELLVQQSLESFPDSRWARMEMANLEMNRTIPNVSGARSHYEHMRNLPRPSTRLIGELGMIAVDCFSEQKVNQIQVESAFSIEPESLESDVEKAFLSIADMLRARPCKGLSQRSFADRVADWLDDIGIEETSKTKWRLRYLIARIYYYEGAVEEAIEQASVAWNSGSAEAPVAMFIAGLEITQGNYDHADILLDEIENNIFSTDNTANDLLHSYREEISKNSSRREDK